MNVKQALTVLATYLDARAQYERKKSGKPLAPKTLTGYLNTAHLFLQHVTGLVFSTKSSDGKAKPQLLPLFKDTIAQASK